MDAWDLCPRLNSALVDELDHREIAGADVRCDAEGPDRLTLSVTNVSFEVNLPVADGEALLTWLDRLERERR